MPLDSLNFVSAVERIATPAEFWAASPRERLAMLSFALRHSIPTHKWNFAIDYTKRGCGTAGCAVGLAVALWADEGNRRKNSELWEALGVHCRDDDLRQIFTLDGNRNFYGVPNSKVTPQLVASRIDSYLATELANAAGAAAS